MAHYSNNPGPDNFPGNTSSQTPSLPEVSAETIKIDGSYRPEFVVDYIAFQVTGNHEALAQELRNRLGSDWQTTECGRHGYANGMRCGNVSILSDIRRGVYVEITGQGCRELEEGLVPDLTALIAEWLGRGARFTRLDIAFDDRDGVLDIDEMVTCAQQAWYTSDLQTWSVPDVYSGNVTMRTSHGINFGKGRTMVSIHIYDKALQMRKQEHHIRVEYRARKQRAHALAEALVKTGPEGIAGILYKTLDFKIASSNVHKHRWQTQDWWERFIGYAGKARLVTAPAPKTLDRTYQWLRKCVSRSLAMIYDSPGGPQLIENLIDEGRQRCDGTYIPPSRAIRK